MTSSPYYIPPELQGMKETLVAAVTSLVTDKLISHRTPEEINALVERSIYFALMDLYDEIYAHVETTVYFALQDTYEN